MRKLAPELIHDFLRELRAEGEVKEEQFRTSLENTVGWDGVGTCVNTSSSLIA